MHTASLASVPTSQRHPTTSTSMSNPPKTYDLFANKGPSPPFPLFCSRQVEARLGGWLDTHEGEPESEEKR